MTKIYPTKTITIISYVLSLVIMIVFGFFLKSSFLAVFIPSCILTLRGVFSCFTQETRHTFFAITEAAALFMVIRCIPILFS